jgi:hypothetical protein
MDLSPECIYKRGLNGEATLNSQDFQVLNREEEDLIRLALMVVMNIKTRSDKKI